jgi:hypothetical protein
MQLTHLAIKGYLYCGAGEYMFPEGRQLPHLLTLCLEYSCDSTDHVFRRSEIDATFLCMVAACPALRSLSLAQIVDGDSVVPGLQGFTRLQELCCWGFSNLHSEVELILAPMTQLTQLTLHCPHEYRDAPHSESLSQGLAQLTQLQKLTLSYPIGLTDAGVLQLTALTRLSSLTIQRRSEVTVGRVQVPRDDDDKHHDCGPVQLELTSRVRTGIIVMHTTCSMLAALSVELPAMYCLVGRIDLPRSSQQSLLPQLIASWLFCMLLAALQAQPPDVWQQLKQVLAQHSVHGPCLRPLLDELQQAHARQQEQLQQARQTIAQLEAQLRQHC